MINSNFDLNECDKEPIHIPSAIQPHGFFIAIDPNTLQIAAASTNIDLFFTFSVQALIGQSLKTFFPLLSEWVTISNENQNYLPQIFALSHSREITRFILVMHQNNEYLILEGEPAQESDLFPDHLAQSVMNEAINLSTARTIDELCRLGVDSLQRLSGFGRVMVYEFDDEYNGCVTSEIKIPEMCSYLDHHFPAADIPVQARELYRKNLIRFIPTSEYTPIPLLNLSTQPIDMSSSVLRSVSPIHLEYLRNMDVSASMSLSIIVDGKLWGLFACHHPTSLFLSYSIRRYCEMFIQLFNAIIQEKIANEASQDFFRLKNQHSSLKEAFQILSNQSNIHNAFMSLGRLWLDALDSDGVCLLQNGNSTVFGITPDLIQIQDLSKKIALLYKNDLYFSSSLMASFPESSLPDSIAGVIRLIISYEPYTEIFWFRKEWVRDLKWAGNPDHKSDIELTQRINPRKSFETLVVQQRGKSLPWKTSHLLAAELYKEFGSIIELDSARIIMEHQQQLLIQQSKRAIMGEMISAISHQWNQPLNALSLLISSLSILIENSKKIDSNFLEDFQKEGMEKIRFMNETIHTFRNFFKPDKIRSEFSMKESIQEVGEQLLPQLHYHNIHLIIDNNPGIIYGFPNEFKQIILNLLSNAHDVLIEKNITNPWVKCSFGSDNGYTLLKICDNGGGIPVEYLNRIFTPYFSTKVDDGTRGIGLYLTQMIVEEHFQGSIIAENADEGACFTLKFREC